uniref:Mytilin 4 n=1 Tax=Perna canaliculus TaxID=38949 RepID=A0A6B9XNG9_PERCI|nr:mytilin 4 [Perna canaliculus]
MKAVVLSVFLVVVVLGVTEVNANCFSCPSTCARRGCRYFACATRLRKSYCCCFVCNADSFYKIGHVNEMTPREQFDEQLLMEIKDYKH